jgi:hypothetical protein
MTDAELVLGVSENHVLLVYRDETWGSCRHWQTVDSIAEISDPADFNRIVNEKDYAKTLKFKPAWEFEAGKREFNDSAKNRHRDGIYLALIDNKKIYVVRRWSKNHPSCNRGKWLSGWIFFLIINGEVKAVVDKRIKGY